MGCNQVTSTPKAPVPKQKAIPCTAQEIGQYINDARANPQKYARIVSDEMDKFLDEYTIPLEPGLNYRTNEGKSVWKETIDFLQKQQSLPPLQKHQGLCQASTIHACDLAQMSQIAHIGSDQSNPLQRIQRFCKKTYGKSGENIGTDFILQGRNHAYSTVIGLIIDDGVASRGHRLSIFDQQFKYYGSATRIQEDKTVTVITYLSENWKTF